MSELFTWVLGSVSRLVYGSQFHEGNMREIEGLEIGMNKAKVLGSEGFFMVVRVMTLGMKRMINCDKGCLVRGSGDHLLLRA